MYDSFPEADDVTCWQQANALIEHELSTVPRDKYRESSSS